MVVGSVSETVLGVRNSKPYVACNIQGSMWQMIVKEA